MDTNSWSRELYFKLAQVSSPQATGSVLLPFPGLLLHCSLRYSQSNVFLNIYKMMFWLQPPWLLESLNIARMRQGTRITIEINICKLFMTWLHVSPDSIHTYISKAIPDCFIINSPAPVRSQALSQAEKQFPWGYMQDFDPNQESPQELATHWCSVDG